MRSCDSGDLIDGTWFTQSAEEVGVGLCDVADVQGTLGCCLPLGVPTADETWAPQWRVPPNLVSGRVLTRVSHCVPVRR
jgi:hypothetical protein